MVPDKNICLIRLVASVSGTLYAYKSIRQRRHVSPCQIGNNTREHQKALSRFFFFILFLFFFRLFFWLIHWICWRLLFSLYCLILLVARRYIFFRFFVFIPFYSSLSSAFLPCCGPTNTQRSTTKSSIKLQRFICIISFMRHSQWHDFSYSYYNRCSGFAHIFLFLMQPPLQHANTNSFSSMFFIIQRSDDEKFSNEIKTKTTKSKLRELRRNEKQKIDANVRLVVVSETCLLCHGRGGGEAYSRIYRTLSFAFVR